MSSVPPFNGVYINLERNKKRRASIEEQLRRLQLQASYRRIAAIDGRALQQPLSSRIASGEVATFMSHIEALHSLKPFAKCGHILEDDSELSDYVGPVMSYLIGKGVFDEFDIVYTDIIVVPYPEIVSLLRGIVGKNGCAVPLRPADFSVVDLQAINFSGANSYFVGPRAIEPVADMLNSELNNGPTLPIDLCLSKSIKHGTIRAACVMPFVTSVDLDLSAESDVAGRVPQAADKTLAIDLLRRLFFVGTRLDGRLSGLLSQLVGKEVSCKSHSDYLDAIQARLEDKPVMG